MFPLHSFPQAFTNVLWRPSLQETPVKHSFLRQRHSLRAPHFERFQREVLKWVNPEQGSKVLREDTVTRWAELTTNQHSESLPYSVWPTTPKIGAAEISSSFVFRRSSFPLDLFQDKTHSFLWLSMSSWKLSNESRCSNSHTYFPTQTFITASHPKLKHYLLGNSQSLQFTKRLVRLFLWLL